MFLISTNLFHLLILMFIIAACTPMQSIIIASTPTGGSQAVPSSSLTSNPVSTLAPTPTLTHVPTLVPTQTYTSVPTLVQTSTLAPIGEIKPIPGGFIYLGDIEKLALRTDKSGDRVLQASLWFNFLGWTGANG